MSDVCVRVLGPLRAQVDGEPVDLGGRRQRAVLARLASAGGEVVAADTLVDDLWRDAAPPRALASLQVYVAHLRRTLEPARPPRAPATVLVSAAPGYALTLPVDRLDSRWFSSLLDGADALPAVRAEVVLSEALALWAGPAFAEFADEPWAATEVAHLSELRLLAVERRARARLELGRAATAVPELERLVYDHPLREGAVWLLALALYRDGRQADALAVLARAKRRLAEQLGVDPGPALRDLERDVLAQAEPLLHRAPDPVPGRTTHRREPAGTGRHGLVGRDRELTRLRAIAARVADGAAPPAEVALVAADAGGGKTSLVEAFRAELAGAGWTTAIGRCPEIDGAPPGWAWREVVEQILAAHPADPALAARLAPLRDPAGPAETFWVGRAVVELLSRADRRVLIVLDDLHRAEEETLRLLRSVVAGTAAGRTARLLVVATLRPSEVGPGVAVVIAALAEPITDRITLPGLDASAVRVLLARHGVSDPVAETVSLVRERTGGNPLFVREIARLIATDGDAAALAVPDGVRDVLRRRLARLPAAAQTVLRHAAVLGRDVDVDALLAIAPGPEAALDALELGVLNDLLVEPEPGGVRFAHALVRDTLYADVPRLRRNRLHAAALDALAATADVTTLAHHALAAGPAVPPSRTLPLTTAAARASSRFGSFREAARLWGAAVDLAPDAGLDVAAEVDLRCAQVSALAHAGDAAAAVTARDTAIARAAGTDRLHDALTSFDAPTSWSIRAEGRIDQTRIALIEQQLVSTTDLARRTRLLVSLVLETESGDDDRARTASAEAMELSVGLDPPLRCAALNARGFVVNGPHLRAELEPVGRELLAVAEHAGLTGYRAVGHHLLFMVCTGRLDLDGAQWHADAAVAIAPGGQLGFTIAWSAVYTAMRALIAGDTALAEAEYAAAARGMATTGGVNTALMGLFGLLAVRHAQGRLGELVPLVLALPPHDHIAEVAAAVLVGAGRLDEAAAVWRPDVEPLPTCYWQLFTVLRAETAIALGNREIAAACYAGLLPWAGTLAGVTSGSTTLGPVDLTLADLAEFLGRPDSERSAHLAGALAVARAVGADHWVKRALAG